MGIAKCMIAGALVLAGVSAGAMVAHAEDVTLTLWSLDRDIQLKTQPGKRVQQAQ